MSQPRRSRSTKARRAQTPKPRGILKARRPQMPKRVNPWRTASAMSMARMYSRRPPRATTQGFVQTSAVAAPVAKAYGFTQTGPRFNGFKSFRLAHSEFLETVLTNASGNVNTVLYNVNAGLTDDFPWLGIIGQNFEYYRMLSLVYRYVPICTTTTSGGITMTFNYDSNEPAFANQDTMAAYEGSTTGALWTQVGIKFIRALEQKQRDGKYFIRTGAQPENTDIREYDVATFQYRVDNAPANTTLGRLYVDYDVEFMCPRSAQPEATASYYATSDGGADTYFNSAAPIRGYLPKTTASAGYPSAALSGPFANTSPIVGNDSSVNIPPGFWRMAYNAYQSPNSSGYPSWTMGGTEGLAFGGPGAALLDAGYTANVSTGLGGTAPAFTAFWDIYVTSDTLIQLLFTGLATYRYIKLAIDTLSPDQASTYPSLKDPTSVFWRSNPSMEILKKLGVKSIPVVYTAPQPREGKDLDPDSPVVIVRSIRPDSARRSRSQPPEKQPSIIDSLVRTH